MAASAALTPLSWAALLPLPAALDALVTGFAFLLLARLTLERSAQAGGLPLLLGHVVVPYLRLRHLCRSPRRSLRRWPRRGCAGARPDVRRTGCRPAARRFSALRPPRQDRRSSRGGRASSSMAIQRAIFTPCSE